MFHWSELIPPPPSTLNTTPERIALAVLRLIAKAPYLARWNSMTRPFERSSSSVLP
jgi:hypothetical protein